MPNNTMTLALGGDVPFDAFAQAMSSFNSLVQALGNEHAARGDVEWFVDALEKSSAIATIRGESRSQQKVESVVNGFSQIAKSLELNLPMPAYEDATIRHARSVVELLGDQITSVRFETAAEEHIVTTFRRVEAIQLRPAYGAIEGRVQTLTNRTSLRFTLYDSIHDRAVSCYVVEGHDEIMRESWGQRAIVEGLIARDPTTGRPTTVRNVTTVHIVSEELGDYRDARGVVPVPKGSSSPEAVIRRLRDG